MVDRIRIFGNLQYDMDDLPFSGNLSCHPRPVRFVSSPAGAVTDPLQFTNPFMESCATKIVMSAAMGYVMGIGLGLVLGSYENIAPPVPLPGERELPKVPMGEQMKLAWRNTAQKCKSWGNNFMIVTAVFSGVECVIEKSRGQHDMYNGALAGCATGAALAVGSGPQAMCFGCAGFAAFSSAMELLMER